MREKLLQANEAVGEETIKVRVTTLHPGMCLPERLGWRPYVPSIGQDTGRGDNNNSSNAIMLIVTTGAIS